ncbi:glutamate-1-semialdehyde 2,1-aminomutase [Thalassobium sp. R2A62]|nr:glutamate-1-semialdehyde 2,1-aminomutase [Thalassobium sp. R2A62]
MYLGNPVAAAAGLKTLEVLRRKGGYDILRAIAGGFGVSHCNGSFYWMFEGG